MLSKIRPTKIEIQASESLSRVPRGVFLETGPPLFFFSVIIISILTTMAGLLPLSGGCLSYLSHLNLHVHCTLKTTAGYMLDNAHCIL